MVERLVADGWDGDNSRAPDGDQSIGLSSMVFC
jgi:hypothetical protein